MMLVQQIQEAVYFICRFDVIHLINVLYDQITFANLFFAEGIEIEQPNTTKRPSDELATVTPRVIV